MYSSATEDNVINLVCSSDLRNIDRFCNELKAFIAGLGLTSHLFVIELILREALINAIVHGNGEDPAKSVSCSITAGDRAFTISIRDEGPGFDWRSALNREIETEKQSGRGVAIMKMYASSVKFNDTGNEVILARNIMEDTMADIQKKNGNIVICPGKNIIASNVGELREELKGLLAEEVENVTVDLTGVEMIDSVGLGLLISLHNTLKKTGGRLSVVNASKDLLDLFKNMRLDQHFDVRAN